MQTRRTSLCPCNSHLCTYSSCTHNYIPHIHKYSFILGTHIPFIYNTLVCCAIFFHKSLSKIQLLSLSEMFVATLFGLLLPVYNSRSHSSSLYRSFPLSLLGCRPKLDGIMGELIWGKIKHTHTISSRQICTTERQHNDILWVVVCVHKQKDLNEVADDEPDLVNKLRKMVTIIIILADRHLSVR